MSPDAPFAFALKPFTFPKLRLVADPFGDGKVPDATALFRALFACARREAGPKLQTVVAFWTHAARRRLRLVGYCADERLVPIEVALDEVGLNWLTRLDTDFQSDHGLLLSFDASGDRQSTLSAEDVAALETRPAALAARHAPPGFRRRDEAKKKEAHLAKLVARVPGPGKVDLAALEKTWRAFLKGRGGTQRRGVSEKALDATAARLGVALPAEVRRLYVVCDGAPRLFFGHDFLSLTALEKEVQTWSAIYDEWPLKELRGNTRGQAGVTNDLYACPLRLPFVDLVGGNALAFDLLPGPKGGVGQVITCGRDVETLRRIAPSPRAFLEECLTFDGKSGPLASVFTALRF